MASSRSRAAAPGDEDRGDYPGLAVCTWTNARSKVGAATTAQLVWILAQRLPEPESIAQTDE